MPGLQEFAVPCGYTDKNPRVHGKEDKTEPELRKIAVSKRISTVLTPGEKKTVWVSREIPKMMGGSDLMMTGLIEMPATWAGCKGKIWTRAERGNLRKKESEGRKRRGWVARYRSKTMGKSRNGTGTVCGKQMKKKQ